MSKSIKLKNNIYLDSSSISHNRKKLSDIIYPIGSIYLSVNSTSPATLFGGTWERIYNRFLIGGGNDYECGSAGGNKTITLQQSNLPSSVLIREQGTASSSNTQSIYVSEGWSNHAIRDSRVEGTTYGESINIMPPYLAIYMWKRTA